MFKSSAPIVVGQSDQTGDIGRRKPERCAMASCDADRGVAQHGHKDSRGHAYEKRISFAATQSGSGAKLDSLVAFATAHGKLVAWSETAAHSCDYVDNELVRFSGNLRFSGNQGC
jgi:hypothetical protein